VAGVIASLVGAIVAARSGSKDRREVSEANGTTTTE
jgi:hypothetical protein